MDTKLLSTVAGFSIPVCMSTTLLFSISSTVIISDAKLAKELFSDNAASGRLLDNPLFFEFTKGNHGKIFVARCVLDTKKLICCYFYKLQV